MMSEQEDKMFKEVDSLFKKAVEDKHILSTILMGCVEEFRDKTMEETLACLEVSKRAHKVKTWKTYIINENNEWVELDSVFKVTLPNDERMGIIINLEGQGKYNPGYPIYNRATYYASQLIVDQKGDEFIGSNYGDMKKVYSVWVMMNPPKELRGTAIEYADTPRYIEPLSSDTPLVHHDLVRKILVNLDTEARAELPVGDELSRNERSSVMMDMLKIVLKDKMAPEEKRDVLKEEYKIPVSNSVFRVIRGIGMSMSNEELFQAYKDAQVEKYLDAMEAEIVAKVEANAEAKAEAKARLKITADNVRNLMSKLNLSIDESMDLLNVDESIREDVTKAIESQGPED